MLLLHAKEKQIYPISSNQRSDNLVL